MRKFKNVAAAALMGLGLLGGGTASAVEVTCGDSSLGIRVTMVDPGLAGGYCYAQNGNLQNSDIAALGLTQLEKDVAPDGGTSGLLQYTLDSSARTSGTWGIASSVWNSWQHLYLAFHFGGAGDTTSSNPDSFIVEIARPDVGGTWALGPDNATLTGLSNIYLLSKDRSSCTVNCGGSQNEIPEPASLALVGLALTLGAAARRRRS